MQATARISTCVIDVELEVSSSHQGHC